MHTLLLVLAAAATAAAAATVTELPLVCLQGMTDDNAGNQRAVATILAIEHVNANRTDYISPPAGLDLSQGVLPPGYNLTYALGDTQRTATVAAGALVDLLPVGPVGILGASSSDASISVQVVAALFGLPQVSYASTSAALSDTELFPTFRRVVPSDTLQASAHADLVRAFNWTTFACVGSTSAYGLGILDSFTEDLAADGLQPTVTATFAAGAAEAMQTAVDTLLVSGARVILLACSSADMAVFMPLADAAGLVGDGYTWLLTDALAQNTITDRVAPALLQGAVGTVPDANSDSDAYARFVADVWVPLNESMFPQVGSGLDFSDDPNAYAPFAYDAVWLYAFALRALADAGADDLSALGPNVLADQIVAGPVFTGLTGDLALDATGDRAGAYKVRNFVGDSFATVGTWSEAGGIALDPAAPVTWSDGTTDVPTDVLVCPAGAEMVEAGAISYCRTCSEGSYNLDAQGQCYACPEGAECPGGAELYAQEGFWRLGDAPDFYQCLPGACCPGGGCNVTQPCAEHRHGFLCGSCDDGFSEVNGVCVPCDGARPGAIASSAGMCLALMLLWMVRPQSTKGGTAVFKVLIDYLQLLVLVLPPDASQAYYILLVDVTGYEAAVGECFLPMSPLATVVASAYLPIVLSLWLVVMFAGNWLAMRLLKPGTRMHRGGYIRAAWRVLLIVYPSLCRLALELVNCRTVGDRSVLWSAPAVTCFETPGHSLLVAIFMTIFIAIAVLLPIGLTWFLKLQASKMRAAPQKRKSHFLSNWFESFGDQRGDNLSSAFGTDESEEAAAAAEDRQSRNLRLAKQRKETNKPQQRRPSRRPSFLPAFDEATELDESAHQQQTGGVTRANAHISHNHKAVYGIYRMQVRTWYESAFLTRRTLFVIVSVLGRGDLVARQLIFLFLTAFTFCQHIVIRPMRHWWDNVNESAAMLGLLLVVAVTLLGLNPHDSTDFTMAPETTVCFFVIVALTTPAMLAHSLYVWWRRGRWAMRQAGKQVERVRQRRRTSTLSSLGSSESSGSRESSLEVSAEDVAEISAAASSLELGNVETRNPMVS